MTGTIFNLRYNNFHGCINSNSFVIHNYFLDKKNQLMDYRYSIIELLPSYMYNASSFCCISKKKQLHIDSLFKWGMQVWRKIIGHIFNVFFCHINVFQNLLVDSVAYFIFQKLFCLLLCIVCFISWLWCKVLIFVVQPWLGGSEGMDIDWQAAIGNPSSYVVKRVLRLEIPVDRFPNVSQPAN